MESHDHTIGGPLRACADDQRDRWDDLVLMLATLTSKSTEKSPQGVHEAIHFRARALVHKVRYSFAVAQRCYKLRSHSVVWQVDIEIIVGDCVFVVCHERKPRKLRTCVVGPLKVLSRGEETFPLNSGGYHKSVSSDHVTAAPDPLRDTQQFLPDHGASQDVAVPGRPQHAGKSSAGRSSLATRWQKMEPCASGRVGGDTTPKRTIWSRQAASTVSSSTSTCDG